MLQQEQLVASSSSAIIIEESNGHAALVDTTSIRSPSNVQASTPIAPTTPPTRAPVTANPSRALIPSDDDLLPNDHNTFNYCNGRFLGVPNEPRHSMDIWYQCRGPKYDAFAAELRTFVQGTYKKKPQSWGRRITPLPSNHTYLFIGNSHTRQIALSVACQMGLGEVTSVHKYEFQLRSGAMAVRYRFRNGADMTVVANSYIPYSPTKWQQLLEKQMQQSLSDFDAIVLGYFNDWGHQSRFNTGMEAMIASFPEEYEMDFSKDGMNMTLDAHKLASAYDGPIILTSKFALVDPEKFWNDCETLKKDQIEKRQGSRPASSMFLCLDSRKYIEELGIEGAACSKTIVDDLYDVSSGKNNGVVQKGEKKNRDASNTQKREKAKMKKMMKKKKNRNCGMPPTKLHRCVGQKGGHPDLLAWDISEFFHQQTKYQRQA